MADATKGPAPDEATQDPRATASQDTLDQLLVEEDLVVEEVSIDGMCGVY